MLCCAEFNMVLQLFPAKPHGIDVFSDKVVKIATSLDQIFDSDEEEEEVSAQCAVSRRGGHCSLSFLVCGAQSFLLHGHKVWRGWWGGEDEWLQTHKGVCVCVCVCVLGAW